ncbi:hypothetical protein F2Q69_00017525 [Brassica cretica]|uniref:Uncharacterized protein n=1 Tax=Brassica cretica TaxID=69181 RepID=A0A8S9QYQ1_BRACR|nr:hypothetical protein F2Q69_00017525 [Brassica cretica]
MSSSNYYRSWIDRPHLDPNTRLLTEEYQRGITEFMGLVQRQPEAETEKRFEYRYATEEELEELKQREFSGWMLTYIDDGVVRDVLSLIETQKEDEETRLSQLQTDLDATSTASTNLSRIRINEIVESSVPKKKGRLVGLGRRARSVPPSAPQSYVDPEVLMEKLKDKDDRIAALEQKMADQEAGWEVTRKQNEQMMEKMKRIYPNEQFP